MKIAFQLAYKNLINAGLRTTLNIGVLSIAFSIILFINGIVNGWEAQAKRENIRWEYAKGQLLQKNYNPYNPFSIQDGHAPIPASLRNETTPILIQQANLYQKDRMLPIMIKGIDPQQSTLALPTQKLHTIQNVIPAIIGKRMAQAADLKQGDQVLLQWRDKNGTFDTRNISITGIFDTDVGTVDRGQIWISIKDLWEMTGLYDEATLLILQQHKNYKVENWNYKSQKGLLKELDELIKAKKYSSFILYFLLLSIALLAIFDTQVFAIFRRQKEIGMYIALGMTRWQVVKLFTVEGSIYSLMAIIVGGIYSTPILLYTAHRGLGIAKASQDMGITIADRIYPVYTPTLIISSILLIIVSATIVSFLPAIKIAKMNLIMALKGKVQ